ncbi:Procathepsin L [Linum perenne]
MANRRPSFNGWMYSVLEMRKGSSRICFDSLGGIELGFCGLMQSFIDPKKGGDLNVPCEFREECSIRSFLHDLEARFRMKTDFDGTVDFNIECAVMIGAKGGKGRNVKKGKETDASNTKATKGKAKAKGKLVPSSFESVGVIETGESSKSKSLFRCDIRGKQGQDKIIISTIHDQKKLNLCWAIAIAAATEACFNRGLPTAERLQGSPQELLDTILKDEDKEKDQPLTRIESVWKHIRKHGLAQEDECSFKNGYTLEKDMKKDKRVALPRILISDYRLITKLTDYEKVLAKSNVDGVPTKVKDSDIVQILQVQPVVAMVKAYDSFRAWEGDVIYRGPEPHETSTEVILHAVLLVGYGVDTVGTEDEDIEFFLCRNSYGPGWGNCGFGKIIRGRKDKPSVFEFYSYPIPAKKS